MARLRATVAADPAYGATSVAVSEAADVTRITVPVDGDAVSRQAVAAVRDLRARHVPRAFAGVDAEVLVGGQSADDLDFADIAGDHQPIVFAFVLGLCFLVLARRLPLDRRPAHGDRDEPARRGRRLRAARGRLPARASARTCSASSSADTIEAWLPLFLFTILFGLSMDYHVFLLSRIRERYEDTGRHPRVVRSASARPPG